MSAESLMPFRRPAPVVACPPPAGLRERVAALRLMAGGVPANERAARAWRGMPERIRRVAVLLAVDKHRTPGDPRKLATQAWADFSDADRLSIGATLRDLRAGLGDVDDLR